MDFSSKDESDLVAASVETIHRPSSRCQTRNVLHSPFIVKSAERQHLCVGGDPGRASEFVEEVDIGGMLREFKNETGRSPLPVCRISISSFTGYLNLMAEDGGVNGFRHALRSAVTQLSHLLCGSSPLIPFRPVNRNHPDPPTYEGRQAHSQSTPSRTSASLKFNEPRW